MLRIALMAGLGVFAGSTAHAESVGACAWAKVPADVHEAFLKAYHDDINKGMAVLGAHNAQIKPLIEACAGGVSVPQIWGAGAVGSQAARDGAGAELQAKYGVDRAKLEQTWANADGAAKDCFRGNAAKVYGLKGPACPDPKAMIRLVDALGVPHKAFAVKHASNFFNSTAQGEWAETLIAEAIRRAGAGHEAAQP